MATNKNQHFVPRCYLRPFTTKGAGKSINVFNIDRRRLIPLAPVRSQCSRDYFYGKDPELEAAIQFLEQSYAKVLRGIESASYVLTDEDSDLLRKFWLFQYLRTEAASIRSVQVLNAATEAMGLSSSEYKAEMKQAVQSAMRTFVEKMHIMDDMSTCLVLNKTGVPFATSDDPAILTNRLHLEYQAHFGKTFGLRQSGSIMILPLTPSVLFLGYDRDVYAVRDKKSWVTIRAESDALAYNEHQLLNCRANIYFREECNDTSIPIQFERAVESRPGDRYRIHTMVFDRSEGDHRFYKVAKPAQARSQGEMMVHMEAVNPVVGSWPIHLGVKVRCNIYSDGSGAGFLRRCQIWSATNSKSYHKIILRPFTFGSR
jgi:hypothetical protein